MLHENSNEEAGDGQGWWHVRAKREINACKVLVRKTRKETTTTHRTRW